jgi:hypothetical protein
VTKTFNNVVHSSCVIFQCRCMLEGTGNECEIRGKEDKYNRVIKRRKKWSTEWTLI